MTLIWAVLGEWEGEREEPEEQKIRRVQGKQGGLGKHDGWII